jgi:hypothetical protein
MFSFIVTGPFNPYHNVKNHIRKYELFYGR